ncbi:hypothetical protein D3C75_1359770 [compost metagenome]
MTGMSGVSSTANMSKNCGMEGMHGGTQSANHQHTEATQQNHTPKIPDQYRGQTVDIKV